MADYIFNIPGTGCDSKQIGSFSVEDCGQITSISTNSTWADVRITATTDGKILLTVPENSDVTNGRSEDVTISYIINGSTYSIIVSLCQANKHGDTPEPPVPSQTAVTIYTLSDTKSANCTDLELNTLKPSVISSLIEDKTTIKSAIINGDCVDEIAWQTFTGCTNLTSVTISEGVENVGGFGCQSDNSKACISLTGITIPNSTKVIGDSHAFKGCSALTECIFGENSHLETIGISSFEDCTSLTGITIPSTVQRIDNSAFDTCTSLTGITIPNSVTSIGDYAFMYSGLKSIIIPNSVTSIGNSIFNRCTGLTSVTIGTGLTSISESAFTFCTSIRSLTIPSKITSIGDHAFQQSDGGTYTTSLTSVTFANGSQLRTIGDSAFYGSTGLTSIEIPSSITSIDHQAFNRCSNLASVTCLAATPPTLGSNVFSMTPIDLGTGYIYVPSTSVNAYKAASGWSMWASRIQAIP